MKIVEQIKQPIAFEMDLFEQKFQLSMSTNVALLNRITHYIVNRKGKQMRPMFVFLTAKMVSGGTINERSYRGASVIELIHTASYISLPVAPKDCARALRSIPLMQERIVHPLERVAVVAPDTSETQALARELRPDDAINIQFTSCKE